MIQSKPPEKGEIITYLSRMGDVLEDIFKRCNVIIIFHGIHVVVDGDIANTMLQEVFLSIIACFRIVAAQS